MDIKVRGGTARGDENLCLSCRWAAVRESAQGQLMVKCAEFDVMITTATVRCSDYQNKNTTSLTDMEKIAWIVTTDAKGRVGFRPIKDMTKQEKKDAGVSTYSY